MKLKIPAFFKKVLRRVARKDSFQTGWPVKQKLILMPLTWTHQMVVLRADLKYEFDHAKTQIIEVSFCTGHFLRVV